MRCNHCKKDLPDTEFKAYASQKKPYLSCSKCRFAYGQYLNKPSLKLRELHTITSGKQFERTPILTEEEE